MKENDVALIQRTLDGDESAFTTLVKKYQKWVHTLVWRKIGDFHIAEELTQDIFLKVYKKLSTLKPFDRFPGWLYVITTRHCITWLRKKRVSTTSLNAMSATELEALCYARYEAARGEEASVEHQRELVKRLLQKLPESERTVVTLFYLAEMTGEEISLFLGVSHNTVRSRLRRARERLEKEEHMIREVLGSFQIPGNLTENVMREVTRLKPASPSVSKPWLPWGLSFASTFLVILMLGFGTRALSRFQQPYSLDATSEMTVELVEAPVTLALELKRDLRNQHGNANSIGNGKGTGLSPKTYLLAAAQTDTVEVLKTKPQWVQTKGPVGGKVKNLFATSQKELYAIGDIGLYRLTGDHKTEWTLINDSLPFISSAKSMTERGDTLYVTTETNVLKSTDQGVTWQSLGERPHGRTVALLITDPSQARRPQDAQFEMYLILTNSVFRSTDAGNTWHLFNAGLTIPRIQDAAAIENVLFLATTQGLYRLASGVWEKLPIVQAQSIDSLTVAGNRIYLSSINGRDPQSGLLFISLFTSSDFGDSWTDITPPNRGFRLPVELVAIDKTVLVLLGIGVLRSTDVGDTWEDLGYHKHAFTISRAPADSAIALDKDTFFVVGARSVGHSTDGGNTWHPVSAGIAEIHVLDLAEVNNVLYALTDKGIAKSTDGGEKWAYILTEMFFPKNKPLSALRLSNMTAVKDSLYLRAKQGGSTNCLLQLSPNTDTLLHIEDMPVYVNPRHGEWLERIADTTVTLELDETDRTDLARYLLGIEEATTRTTGEFAVSDDTFYIEYERKLYRWTRGDLKWHDTDMKDAPVFESFYATNGFQIAASGKVVYLGKSSGSLFQSLDGGNTWTDVTENFPLSLNKAVSHTQLLENLPHFKEIVFVGDTVCVSTNDGVAISDDGKNWHVLTDSKDTPIAMRHLAVDGTTLCGVSETGAYRFKKSTRTWIQIASEIPKRITSLVVGGNVLYVGTEHRGVLRLSMHEL